MAVSDEKSGKIANAAAKEQIIDPYANLSPIKTFDK